MKIKGEVEVLGLISLGIFMKAAFTYIPALEKAIVKATIIVEVDVLMFSGEVEIEYEKRFGGIDPTFGESVTAAAVERLRGRVRADRSVRPCRPRRSGPPCPPARPRRTTAG